MSLNHLETPASETSTQKNAADATVEAASDASPTADYRGNFLATFTPEEEKKIMRKIDYRLLLLCGIIYMIKQIDVNNAASVKVLSVGKPTNILTQLGMSSDQYNWVQSVYYLPSNLLLKRMTPRHFQTRIMFLWGLVLACHAAVRNTSGILAARFFLGLAEAGLFPSLMTHFSSWYRSDEFGKPMMWLFGVFNLAGIVGSILVYGISFLDGKQGLSSWQWVFLIQGVATMAFASIVYLLYPDYPKSERTMRWLSPREQEFVELRLASNAPVTSDAAFSSKESWDTFKDPKLWAFCLTQTLMNTGGFGLTWFLPTIVTNLGFTAPPNNILLLIPPAAATIITITIAAWVLKRAWFPRPLVALTIVLFEVAVFAIFISTNSKGAIYFACVTGSALSNSFAIPFWSWRSSSLKGTTGTAFAFGLQSGIGQLGGVIGPQIFQSKYGPTYRVPYSVCTACIAGGFFGCWLCYYLTASLEKDVRRVQLNRIKASKEGKLYAGDDIQY
ncbi:retrograde regulation protein 2 [Thozetella sp. PMI_491]|nr:retrograde regulation protein 2 [Thozetella sp. PMI_491]